MGKSKKGKTIQTQKEQFRNSGKTEHKADTQHWTTTQQRLDTTEGTLGHATHASRQGN